MRYFFFIFFAGFFVPLLAFAQTAGPGFISLSDIPAFSNITGAVNLSEILNNIYGLCIGIAAVLAVVIIMYAGLMYMGGDSITEKKVAREKIAKALFGLLLVLSPAIVFGIIDKRILSLKIDTGPLTPSATSGNIGSNGLPNGGTWTTTDVTEGTKECQKQGGTVTTNANGIKCTAAATSCPVLTGTSVKIAADGSQDACCTGSYKLTKGVRGQNSCTAISCPVLTGNSVVIAADGSQDSCCTGEYTLNKGVRGQNSCKKIACNPVVEECN